MISGGCGQPSKHLPIDIEPFIMRLIRSNSGNAAHEMAVFIVTYDLNPTKPQLTGQQFIENFKLFTQRWVCHGPGKSWVFCTPRALSRSDPIKRLQVVNVAQTINNELPTQSIEGRSELKLDLMNAPEIHHDFINLGFSNNSTDPFIYRFHRLEEAAMQKLQRYIDLTDQYPDYFARVENATLVTETKGRSDVTCPGIIGARNQKDLPLFRKCDKRMKVGKDLKKYIYIRVKKITGLLTENGYVLDDQDLERHLQIWRNSGRYQLKLGESLTERIKENLLKLSFEAFLNTRDDLPSVKNISEAKEMNEPCLEDFCKIWELKSRAAELTPESESKATINLEEIYAYVAANTVPLSNNL